MASDRKFRTVSAKIAADPGKGLTFQRQASMIGKMLYDEKKRRKHGRQRTARVNLQLVTKNQGKSTYIRGESNAYS